MPAVKFRRALEMLTNFLGRHIKVNREFYHLPEETLQLAKCGNMLVLMDEGKLTNCAGKTLSEIEIDLKGMEVACNCSVKSSKYAFQCGSLNTQEGKEEY